MLSSIFHTVCLGNYNNGENIIFTRHSPPIHHISLLIDIVSLLRKCSCDVICNVVVGALVLIKYDKRKKILHLLRTRLKAASRLLFPS